MDRFIDTVLAEATSPERDEFLKGWRGWTRAAARCSERMWFGHAGTADGRSSPELSSRRAAQEDRRALDFFTAIKSMTITGYYTPQIGLQQELGDDGRLVLAEFEGCTHRNIKSSPGSGFRVRVF